MLLSITADQVKHVAALARLELDAGANAVMAGNLNNILQYVNMLNKLDITGVAPTSHALNPQDNVLREDQAVPGLPPGAATAAAPAAQDGMFKVPRVVEV